LSIDGRYSPGTSDGTLTLRQRGIPLDGQGVLNIEAGVVDQSLLPLNRVPTRVAIPSSTLRGLSVEWLTPSDGSQLLLSSGTPGRLEPTPGSGFFPFSGKRDRFGAQWRLGASNGLDLSLLHERGSKVDDTLNSMPGASTGGDQRSSLITTGWKHGAWSWMANAIQATSKQPLEASHGWWIEAAHAIASTEQAVGLYHLESGLNWAGISMPSNLQGGFWKFQHNNRQISLHGTLDLLRSLERFDDTGFYGSVNGSMRVDRLNRVGGGFAVREFRGKGLSAYADWRRTSDFGATGLRVDVTQAQEGGRDERRLSLDHEWNMPLGWMLNTSAGLARTSPYSNAGQDINSVLAAASFTVPLTAQATLRGTIGAEMASRARDRFNLNLNASWRLTQDWSLDAQILQTTGLQTAQSLDPLAPSPTTQRIPGRSFLLMLRYEHRAGTRMMPLGGEPQHGGGSVEGTVFYDENRNGRQEANERGVAGVTVTLDSRWAVRTDGQGKFAFPLVASGTRKVSVRNEALPLPWSVAPDAQKEVLVTLRETATITIAVQREP